MIRMTSDGRDRCGPFVFKATYGPVSRDTPSGKHMCVIRTSEYYFRGIGGRRAPDEVVTWVECVLKRINDRAKS